MLKLRLICVVLAFAVLPAACTQVQTGGESNTANAEQKEQSIEFGGPPTKEQIVGIWRFVDAVDLGNIIEEGMPWAAPYQFYAFYEDGRHYSMMSTYDTESTAASLEKAFSALPPEHSPRYTYDAPFITISYPDAPDGTELWGMNLFAEDFGEKIKKGDLIMPWMTA